MTTFSGDEVYVYGLIELIMNWTRAHKAGMNGAGINNKNKLAPNAFRSVWPCPLPIHKKSLNAT